MGLPANGYAGRKDHMVESADKPGSVESNHSSGMRVAAHLKQPTREQCGPHHRSPIWSCSGWGLPCRRVLPPTRCALTAPFQPYRPPERGLGGVFSVALSVGSRPPGVTWHPALWSPDFPLHPGKTGSTAIAWPTPRRIIPHHTPLNPL